MHLGGKLEVDFTVARFTSDLVAPGVPTNIAAVANGESSIQVTLGAARVGGFRDRVSSAVQAQHCKHLHPHRRSNQPNLYQWANTICQL